MWMSFNDWLLTRPDQIERLIEVSHLFDRHGYNVLFQKELDRLIADVDDPVTRSELEQAKGMDWIGYIARSLRNSGFRDHDIDPLTHEIVVRLLVQPGSLFRGWNGQPLTARFKLAVRNAILNILEKRRTRRRRLPAAQAVSDDIAAFSAPDESAIEDFRRLVQDRLGDLAQAVLDVRLDGGDTKSLVKAGGVTSYRLKQTVQAIKALARDYGDAKFQMMVARALDRESRTLQRRFAVPATG